jgi:hypothetical protein
VPGPCQSVTGTAGGPGPPWHRDSQSHCRRQATGTIIAARVRLLHHRPHLRARSRARELGPARARRGSSLATAGRRRSSSACGAGHTGPASESASESVPGYASESAPVALRRAKGRRSGRGEERDEGRIETRGGERRRKERDEGRKETRGGERRGEERDEGRRETKKYHGALRHGIIYIYIIYK